MFDYSFWLVKKNETTKVRDISLLKIMSRADSPHKLEHQSLLNDDPLQASST